METSTTFVLGILSGSFFLGMVYGVMGIVKMKKSQKQLQATVNSLEKQNEEVHGRIDSLLTEMHHLDNETCQRLNRRDDIINQRIDEAMIKTSRDNDEVLRYVDSRIDKTIDVLQGNINSVYKETEKLNS
jgi:hypothetical protein